MAISVRGRASAMTASGGTTNTLSITYPAGVVAGDLVLLWATAATGGNLTIEDESGYTVEFEADTGTAASDNQSQLLWRVATGSLSGAISIIMSGFNGGMILSMLVLAGIDTNSPFIAKNQNTSTTSGTTIVTPAVVNTDTAAYMVSFGSATVGNTTAATWSGISTTNSATITSQQNLARDNAGNTNSIYVQLGEAANAGATSSTVTHTLGKTVADWQSWLGFIKPAPIIRPETRHTVVNQTALELTRAG